MSLSLSQKARAPAAPPVQSAPQTGSTRPLSEIGPEVANSEAAAEVGPIAEAATPFLDMAAATGEDPGKYQFAEDGDGLQTAPLPKLREKHATAGYQPVAGGSPFVQGAEDKQAVDPNDVAQGALGDCYLMAGMASVARADPGAIAKLIKDNGDGTYDVTLHLRKTATASPSPTVVTVDGRLPSKGPGMKPLYAQTGDAAPAAEGAAAQAELWPALIEKALAQVKGSYEEISGGNIGNGGFQFAGATEMPTGRKEGYFPTSGLPEDDALLQIAVALDDHKPVSCDSKDLSADADLTAKATAVNVYGNHAYSPTEVDLDGRTVSLQNPWGSSHVTSLPIADFLKYYRSIRIGA